MPGGGEIQFKYSDLSKSCPYIFQEMEDTNWVRFYRYGTMNGIIDGVLSFICSLFLMAQEVCQYENKYPRGT